MSYTLTLGSKAPDFSLINTEKKTYSLKDFADHKGLVIFFTCNHCPYVTSSDPLTSEVAKKYQKYNIGFVAINSNSEHTYKEDSFDNMVNRMKEQQFPWIYLHDQTQEVARRYGALRTPHFFLFNKKRELIYTGRGLDNPLHPEKSHTNDLEKALEEFVHDKTISVPLTNPIGCNIKWEGKDTHWMPPEACDIV